METLADSFTWRPGAIRVVVTISDEAPCDGDPCDDPGADRDAIEAALTAAIDNEVRVIPISGDGADNCSKTLAAELVSATGGAHFDLDVVGTYDEIVDPLADELDSYLDACLGCLGDLDGDGVVGSADLITLLGNWGCTGVCLGDLMATEPSAHPT